MVHMRKLKMSLGKRANIDRLINLRISESVFLRGWIGKIIRMEMKQRQHISQ